MDPNTKSITPNLDHNEARIQQQGINGTTIAVMSGITDTNILLNKVLEEMKRMNSTLNQVRSLLGNINRGT